MSPHFKDMLEDFDRKTMEEIRQAAITRRGWCEKYQDNAETIRDHKEAESIKFRFMLLARAIERLYEPL